MVSLLAEAGQPAEAAAHLRRTRQGAGAARRAAPRPRRREPGDDGDRTGERTTVERVNRRGRATPPARSADACQRLTPCRRPTATCATRRTRAEGFRTTLYAAHPELRGQRSEAPAAGADELAAMVADGRSALVEFVVAPEATFAFVVTEGNPVVTTVHRVALPAATLQRLVDDFVSSLARRNLGFRTPGRAVSQALLAPLEARLRGRSRLVVVPGRAAVGPAVPGARRRRRTLPRGADGRVLRHVADGAARTTEGRGASGAIARGPWPRSVIRKSQPASASPSPPPAPMRWRRCRRPPARRGPWAGFTTCGWGPEATEAAFKREAGAYHHRSTSPRTASSTTSIR